MVYQVLLFNNKISMKIVVFAVAKGKGYRGKLKEIIYIL